MINTDDQIPAQQTPTASGGDRPDLGGLLSDAVAALDRDMILTGTLTVAEEIAAQRVENHQRWALSSIENQPPDYRGWLPTLIEEAGEVARALTLEDADPVRLRAELVDLAAVAVMWVNAIDHHTDPYT